MVMRPTAVLALILADTTNTVLYSSLLGDQVYRNNTNFDVGIWRDENTFVFVLNTPDRKEIDALFDNNQVKDHPRVIAFQPISDKYAKIYTDRTSWIAWSPRQGLEPIENRIQQSNYDKLAKETIRVCYLPWPPHVLEEVEGDSTKLWGYERLMIEALAGLYGFKHVWHTPKDNEWGNIKEKNGSSHWSGMIGEAAYDRADISLSAITIQQARYKVADPSGQYGPEYIQLFAPGPLPLPPIYALFRPFDKFAWALIIGLCLVIPLVVYIILKPISIFTLEYTYVYMVASFFRESFFCEYYDLHGFTYKGRVFKGVYILLGSWLMGANILTMAYTSNLMAVLTKPAYSKPFQDLREVLDSGLPIKMYGIGAGIENEWATSHDPDIKEFYKRREIFDFSINFEELDEVGSGTAVFVDWYTSIGHVNLRFPATEKKKLITLVDTGSQMSPKYSLSWYFRKRFPGKKAISWGVQALLEGGLVDAAYTSTLDRMYRELPPASKLAINQRRKERGLQALSLAELSPAFLSQGILMLACIPILALEIFRRRAATNHQQEEERRQ